MNSLPVEYQDLMTQGKVLDCKYQHPGLNCIQFALVKFLLTTKRFSIFFVPMQFIPMLLFRRKELKEKPLQSIFKATKNSLHSLLFLSSMVGLIRIIFCTLKKFNRPIGGWDGLLIGAVSGSSILLESPGRAYEMTLQLVPRFLESIFWHFQKKAPFLKIKHFELLLFSLIIGLIHYCYQHDQSAIKSTYLKIFSQFWGKN